MKKTVFAVLLVLATVLAFANGSIEKDVKYQEYKAKVIRLVEKTLSTEFGSEYNDEPIIDFYELALEAAEKFGSNDFHGYFEDFSNALAPYRDRVNAYNYKVSDLHAKFLEKQNKEKASKPESDLEFVLRGSTNRINFKQTPNDRIMDFLFGATVALLSLDSGPVRVDKRTYDILKNLLFNFDVASRELYDRGVISAESYNEYHIASLEHGARLEAALHR